MSDTEAFFNVMLEEFRTITDCHGQATIGTVIMAIHDPDVKLDIYFDIHDGVNLRIDVIDRRGDSVKWQVPLSDPGLMLTVRIACHRFKDILPASSKNSWRLARGLQPH